MIFGGPGRNYGDGSGGRTNLRGGAGKQSPRGDEGGKSQERQEEPGAGGAQQDSGHSHDDGPQWSWWREEPWPPTPVGRTTAAEQVVEQPEAETESRRARGMPRIRGARVEQRTLATRPGDTQRNRSDWGPRWSKREEEAQQGRSDEAQPEDRSPEAMAGRRPTKAEPEGRVSPVEWWVTVEAWELGAEVESKGLQAEAELGPRRLEVEVRDTPAPAMLEDGRPTGLAPYR